MGRTMSDAFSERNDVSSRVTSDSDSAADAALLRALFDQAALAVGVVDAQGRLRITSRGFDELIGKAPDAAPASSFPALFHLYNAAGADLLRPEEVPIVRAASGQVVRDAVIAMRRPGEAIRFLRCNAAPIKAPTGNSAGAIALVEDVTAEHTAVTRQNTVRRLLLDTINHELRTPLTVVLANAELLVDVAPRLTEDVRGPILAIVRSSEVLRDTVQHVSDLVDLESFTHADRADVEVRTLLGAVSNRFRYQAHQRAIALDIDCPSGLIWPIDAQLAVKALSALADNALTYGPGESRVTLAARADGDVLRLSVTDRGAGIAAQDQERLMQPFERGLTTLDAPHSRGLGLPLAQAVATSHGGAVYLTSSPGRFTAGIVLP